MEIAVIGVGYVGLVTGVCLAHTGNRVTCIDLDDTRISALKHGRIPFFEPGLEDMVRQHLNDGTLHFQTGIDASLREAELVFLAIGTPSTPTGHADLSNIFECVERIAGTLGNGAVVVVKSTVPVGTCERIEEVVNAAGSAQRRIYVASNPEFLAEGRAVHDCLRPERIVVGTHDAQVIDTMRRLYAPINPTLDRLLIMDVRSAEMAKYACNAMLASRLSMINELAGIAARMGADLQSVSQVLKTDSRIGDQYLSPGPGYGGSCLPKDLRALIVMADTHGEPVDILHSIERVNTRQGRLWAQTISAYFNHDLEDRCVAVWGLSFKPGTDDVRASPSLTLIQHLLASGAQVQAYDPVASDNARQKIANPAFSTVKSAEAACRDADVLAVMTGWEEFRYPDFAMLAATLHARAIFDGVYLYPSTQIHLYGLEHFQPSQSMRLSHATSHRFQPPDTGVAEDVTTSTL